MVSTFTFEARLLADSNQDTAKVILAPIQPKGASQATPQFPV
jgi:hypothetical protein